MWQKMFEKEMEELAEMGVHHTVVKCGTFYSIPQVVKLLKIYKQRLQDETEKEEKDE